MSRLRLDLHVHSLYSGDGAMPPEQIIAGARRVGLDGIAVTDHDTIRGGIETNRLQPADLLVIVGAEIMTDQGEVVGLFLQEEIRERTLERVVEEIRSQGGLVVIPHPFDTLRKSAFHISDGQASLTDAIEVFNSRCIFPSANTMAAEYARAHGLSSVAGSDAHYASEIGHAGIVTDNKDVRTAIASGSVEVFGHRSSPAIHARTKVRKLLGRHHW